MTTTTFFEKVISIVEDLSRDIPASERYRRLIDAVQKIFFCDAVALLKIESDLLTPVAVAGLSSDTMGRRFDIDQHPRFKNIMDKKAPVRFASDSSLPDPYDGLVKTSGCKFTVHDCLGVTLIVDGQPWGVLTLDALEPGTFDRIDDVEFHTFIRLTEAAVKAAETMEVLTQRFQLDQAVKRTLIEERVATEIIGNSRVIHQLKEELDIVAQSHLTVLILGETGVGKELVASYIHRRSPRSDQPLVYVNCAALPINIAESELFGHVKGAYSGATSDRAGKFEIADGATLFLDEVGELPLELQAKMLRVLQNGEIQRVGYDKHKQVDVRIIAATNRDLNQEVSNGNFRADLYHRLSVYPINVPTLKERGSDILLLAGYFLEGNQRRLGLQRIRLDEETARLLLRYQWPGNVRELKHLLSRASLKAWADQGRTGNTITISPKHIGIGPDDIQSTVAPPVTPDPIMDFALQPLSLRESIDQFQTQLIGKKLNEHNNNVAAAARDLGVDRGNFSRLIKRLGVR